MEKEPKFEWAEDLIREKPQTPEEILDILKQVDGTMTKVELVVLNLYGGLSTKTAIVFIERVNENNLWLTTEKGMSMEIELSRVKKARIVEE